MSFCKNTVLTPQQRSDLIRQRMEARFPGQTNFSHDLPAPPSPMGHAAAYRLSSQILDHYRRTHRPESMFITPDDLIETIMSGGVNRWVLMGLYGYVGYLPQPRATQDVDLLVDASQIDMAVDAVVQRWPTLMVDRTPVVVRLRDPGEVAIDSEAKVVIDLMLPSDDLYEAILKQHHTVDESTNHRLPIIEAALAAKFSAFISPYRDLARKQFDVGDFRNIVRGNAERIKNDLAHQLGELIYPGGGEELLGYIDLAAKDQPFSI